MIDASKLKEAIDAYRKHGEKASGIAPNFMPPIAIGSVPS